MPTTNFYTNKFFIINNINNNLYIILSKPHWFYVVISILI